MTENMIKTISVILVSLFVMLAFSLVMVWGIVIDTIIIVNTGSAYFGTWVWLFG